jgi:hypothetical protein
MSSIPYQPTLIITPRIYELRELYFNEPVQSQNVYIGMNKHLGLTAINVSVPSPLYSLSEEDITTMIEGKIHSGTLTDKLCGCLFSSRLHLPARGRKILISQYFRMPTEFSYVGLLFLTDLYREYDRKEVLIRAEFMGQQTKTV